MGEVLDALREFPFLGDASIITVIVVLVLTGRLVPRRYLEDVIRERDAWHEAYESQRAVSQEVRSQNTELLKVNKVFEHFLTSIKGKSEP